ncbi:MULTISPECIES: SMI1/KNR4 family protein [Streptomyces]|uniref:SMI1/KNR4 family protein n=1 Tax=Streptomyces sudanensis TaxID=436397 RepID=A0ABY4TAB9_9ACTN|nr:MULTISPECIES: SMI1/KNR4 family protein [Streptomyces]URN15918.1 SMI1/KNR4 family protein [Streptomyces sudanensis]
MHPAVERLTALIPPAGPQRSRDWRGVERAMGTALPDDYKELVETYGGGVFDETIWLLDPACPDEDYELVAAAAERAEVLANLWQSEPVPEEVRDTGARVIPWAYVEDSGAYLYWLVRPERKPGEWTVMFNEGRGSEWEHYDTSCASFLFSVLTGEAENEYFPQLPVEDHRFDSNDDILE